MKLSCKYVYFGVILIIGLLLELGAVAAETGPIRGFIDSFGYGYRVTVAINGTPLKAIRGGGQQAVRLFASDHPLRSKAGADQQELFILREGENSIAVAFERQGDATHDLKIKLEIPDRYTKPLFHLDSRKRRAGTVERKFVIEKRMPSSFKTVEVNDDNP